MVCVRPQVPPKVYVLIFILHFVPSEEPFTVVVLIFSGIFLFIVVKKCLLSSGTKICTVLDTKPARAFFKVFV